MKRLTASTVLLAVLVFSLLPAGSLGQASDFTAAGLVSGTEYVSPAHGFQVSWDAAWGIDEDRIDPVLLCDALILDQYPDVPVFGSAGNLYNRIDLWLPDLDARFRIVSQPIGGNQIPAALVSEVGRSMGGNAVVLFEQEAPGDTVIVLRHAMNDGTVLLSYNQLVPGTDPDYWIWLQLVALEGRFSDAFARAGSDIASDAFTFGETLAAQEVLDASDAVDLVPASDFGVTSGSTWSSPASGFEVAWVDRYTTLSNLGRAQAGSLAIAPKVGACVPVEIDVAANDGSSLDSIVDREVAEREDAGDEVLIATIQGERGIILSRTLDGSFPDVTYTEIGLSGDGAEDMVASFTSTTLGDAFANRITMVAGAVTINGIAFADTIDLAVIIAAANAPFEE